ncbi:hypothetical protein [Sphingomonas qomolangmaensis]|uniref:Haemolysin activator HlyB C-terminal domain-containing protein n=1 Tax=Sphingomonas qomolangmaensis TaxID=2918765 RepID=A0ABY5L9T3_9SPHN|nr:hypothetical protein [Sphingomonas qomolangmaensis]UUL82622.1 hypothetical protein NMP03_15865 [Sphingomonas qomolangmaensis]
MSGAGRPLWFVGYVLGGWIALRVSFLLLEAVELAAPSLVAQASPAAMPVRARAAVVEQIVASVRRPVPVLAIEKPIPEAPLSTPPDLMLATSPSPPASIGAAFSQERWAPSPRPSIMPAARGEGRFSGTAWLIARDGGRSLSDAGQLGGSQAGVRLRYALGDARTLAATARVSTPLRGSGSEAALGIEWRPVGANVAMIAEQRFGIDGTADGQAVFAVGGVGPTPIAAGLIVEGYGQAGVVARGGMIEGFADGALRLTRPILPGVTVGAGAWGGAQRDAQRIDLGPTATIALPVAGRSLRLSVDWRQRVVGKAAPGSGLAVTLGTDF